MLLEPRLYDAQPPPYRSRVDNNATLLVSWWCTGFSFVIILFRLSGRYIRSEQLFTEDKIMAWSIIPLFGRMAFAHVLMLWGTNNVVTTGLTQLQIDHASMGARLVLAARIFYALFIWMQKFTVSEFLKRLIDTFWNRAYELILKGIRIFLVVTFIAVFIATIAECQPFDHYWQVIPDPGPKCREGLAQIISMATCDIITDIVLIAFPIPIILNSHMHWQRKLSLCVLFSTSLILIAVTTYRVITVIDHAGSQQRRTLWASIEILAATAVSNGLILGSFVRDRGVKKVKKFKHHATRNQSVDQPSISRVMSKQQYGSDEDLFRSVGCRMDSITEWHGQDDDESSVPGVPNQQSASAVGGLVQRSMPTVRESADISPTTTPQNLQQHSSAPSTSEDLSFFASGGILEHGPSPPTTSTERSPSSTLVHSDDSPTDTRTLTRPPAAHPSPFSSKRSSRHSHDSCGLADAGGLLSDPPTSHPSAAPRALDPTDSPTTRPKSLIQVLRESRRQASRSPSASGSRRRSRLGDKPLSNVPTPELGPYDLQLEDPGGLLLDGDGGEPSAPPEGIGAAR